jgi:arginyl-tRNA synthetase
MTAQMHDINLLGAHFDLLLGESDVQPLIPPVIADLRVRNIAVESDGALIIDVTSPGEAKPMPPLLLAKSDGAALYATTDLATIVARKREYNPSRIFYVVDQRQALHFEQVFRAARKGGLADGVELVHVGFGTVNGPDGKPYKTRDGSVAQLSDLLCDAINKAHERLPPDEGNLDHDQLAQLVGLAAIKFADLSSFRTSGYIFDAERLVSLEGRTGPYVQYACVRLGSILAAPDRLPQLVDLRLKSLDLCSAGVGSASNIELSGGVAGQGDQELAAVHSQICVATRSRSTCRTEMTFLPRSAMDSCWIIAVVGIPFGNNKAVR